MKFAVVVRGAAPATLNCGSIDLATLTGELFGATAVPILGGALAHKYGLGFPLWMAAGEPCLFLSWPSF
ncbi:MAG TPA: hypothetical protein VOA78_07475 [Candidatus Dormibacteraeota bacterium]|nr:hypothetical protein [Candidatus Dormibacteraeota bacterium]